MQGWAKVSEVFLSSDARKHGRDVPYPFHVRGVMGEDAGASMGEHFSWNVPDLEWAGFDLSGAADPDGVIAARAALAKARPEKGA